jgi:hypothetical protein
MTTPLITRLEEAAEGSLDLDLLVWASYGFLGTLGETMGHVTNSIDAAYALAEWVLPEMNCVGFDKTPRGVEAYVSRNDVDSGHWVETGEHPSSPALALCIAILKATTRRSHD